jgi:hypothetical protein
MTEPLQEAFFETERARLQRWLPWVHLFRAFRLATRWQNLALAMAGLLLLTAGRWGGSQLPFSSHARGVEPTAYRDLPGWPANVPASRRTIWPWEQEFTAPAIPTVHTRLFPNPLTILAPLGDFVRPATALFERRNSWSQIADSWLHVLLVLFVGSVFGGAITRRVALEFGTFREAGLKEALQFGLREFSVSFGAPLISVVGIGLLLVLGRGIAWLGRIPQFGEPLAAALWGLLLLVSLVLALVVLGVAVAWPLMVAAHSCEGTDGFDALNRAYNYVFVRPWYALWLLALSMLYGAVLLGFLLWLMSVTLHLSEWIAAGPLPDESLARITQAAPALVQSGTPLPTVDRTLAGRVGGVWQRGLATLLIGFVYSYFWTSATLIYLLLRRSADACELTRIYVPKPPRPDGPPLVGVPAVERREQAARGAAPAAAAPVVTPPATNPAEDPSG